MTEKLETENALHGKVEKVLGTNEEKFPVILDGTNNLISLADARAKALWANLAWKKIFGNDLANRTDSFKLIYIQVTLIEQGENSAYW